MKKDDVVVNILTAAGILAVLALLLVFGTGTNLYGNIISKINSASGDGLLNANIYDICYYKGFGVIYGIAFSIALFATAVSAAALFLRKNGAVKLACIASAADALTSVIVLISAAFEGSVGIHRFMAGFYLKDVATDFEITKALGIIPVIMAVIIFILSAALFVFLKMTGTGRLKVYNSGGVNVCRLLLPVMYGSIVLEVIREILINAVCDRAGGMKMTVQTYLKDYYFVKALDFNLPYVWFTVLLVLAVMIFCDIMQRGKSSGTADEITPIRGTGKTADGEVQKNRNVKNFGVRRVMTIAALAEILALIIRAIIYFANPPRLFGYLTLDEAVCDAVEAAYPAYIIMYVLDVLLLLAAAGLIMLKADNKKILMLCTLHAVISIAAVFAGQLAGTAGIYYACTAADIIALVCLFYMAYVGRSHH